MRLSNTALLAVSAFISSALSQTTSSTSTAPTSIVTPTPTQPEMVDNCHAFYNVQTNDTCDAVAAKFDLNFDTFYDWNPSVGELCPYLILGDWV